MGLLFVLLFWAAVLAVMGSVSSGVLAALTVYLTRNATTLKKRARLFALMIPWIVIGIEAIGFAGYAVINLTVLHRDMGLGDSFYANLSNGYRIEAIDVTEYGSVCKPSVSGTFSSDENCVTGVQSLQVDGKYIAGYRSGEPFGLGKGEVPYFVVDTSDDERKNFATEAQWRGELKLRGMQPQLISFSELYAKSRFTRFDFLAFGIGACLPVLGVGVLGWMIVRARKYDAMRFIETEAV